MWLAELATRADVSVATTKFYLREGLLPPGEREGSGRARYDDQHVARLRMIRALVVVGGMGLDDVRRVLDALATPNLPLAEALGAAHLALSPPPAAPPGPEHTARVARLLEERGWRASVDNPHAVALAAALEAMDAAGHRLDDDALATYADAMADVARSDVDRTLALDPDDAAALAVAGTVLADPVLVALRRLGHQHEALERAAGAEQT